MEENKVVKPPRKKKVTELLEIVTPTVDDDNYDPEVVSATKINEDFIAELRDPYNLFVIKSTEPGKKIPKELSGQYTTIDKAKLAIEIYKARRK